MTAKTLTLCRLPRVLVVALMIAHDAQAAPPALPAGLESLGAPSELVVQTRAIDELEASTPWIENLSGFTEIRAGDYLHSHASQQSLSLAEIRAQLHAEKSWETTTFNLTTDVIGDTLSESQEISLDQGEGWIDLREANFMWRASESMDVKAGRQILTWGTGDLLFINDLFPKDWNAFILGRDVEYLKAPSDAVRVSLFQPLLNLDLVVTPVFDADRIVDGRRVVFYNPTTGQVDGADRPLQTDLPEDAEWSLRAYRGFGAIEVALYAYDGFWKSPAGLNPGSGHATFPGLRVWGASVRLPLGPGLFNSEIGYYDSREDDHGDNPLVRNSEWRALAGYEQELIPELTGGLQYYVERMQHHDAYLASLAQGVTPSDPLRQVLTLRLTHLLMQQRLKLSLFNFWSPSDDDGHLRINAHYAWSDHWSLDAGINHFYAHRPDTFFGQLEENSNAFVAARYGF